MAEVVGAEAGFEPPAQMRSARFLRLGPGDSCERVVEHAYSFRPAISLSSPSRSICGTPKRRASSTFEPGFSPTSR